MRELAHAHGWLEPPQLDRHVHTIPLPRLGGVAIYTSFMIAVGATIFVLGRVDTSVALPLKSTLTLLGPALIIFLLGLYDDLYGIGPYGKFGVQAASATLLYVG